MNAQVAAPFTTTERESFFAAQARHRASARRYCVALTLLVGLLTLAVSALLAPILFALIGLVLDLLNLMVPMPDLLGRVGRELGWLVDHLESVSAAHLATLLAIAAVPGFLLLLVAWRRVGRLFGAHRVAMVADGLGLRAAVAGDLEESQLGHLVEEMALAAGRPAPRLQLIDSTACNIGVIGEGGDATLIVTRGLLDNLNRTQTQALVGQAMAALGDGDGVLAERMLRLNAMTGLLMLMANAPLSRDARCVLRPMFRLRGMHDARELAALKDALSKPDTILDRTDGPRPARDWRDGFFLVLFGSALIGVVMVPVGTMALVAPWAALAWRRRRFLADAMAVQFTRDPDALAGAYAALNELPTGLGGCAPWLADLFILRTGSTSLLRMFPHWPGYATRIARLNRMGAQVAPPVTEKMPLRTWLVLLPLCVLLVPLLGALLVATVYASLMVNSLLLGVQVALLHVLLRNYGCA